MGVGKSSVAEALSALEAKSGHRHPAIDLDHIRRAWPAPDGDRFNHELEMANLRDLERVRRQATVWDCVLMSTERLAQLGVVEVPVTALDGIGASLMSLLGPRQVDVPPGLAAVGAPLLGWRVLPTSHDREDLVAIGAPGGDGQWFLGQLIARDGRWDFTFHGPIARYPSKAERSAGLELRWPPAVKNVPVGHVFIDVINTSVERWMPTPLDHFHTVGVLVAAGASPGGYAYAYVGGQPDAFILDPGEYTRVHVTVSSSVVIEAGLGRHSLYAAVPALNMVSEYPLSLTITEEDLEKAAPPRPPQRGPN